MLPLLIRETGAWPTHHARQSPQHRRLPRPIHPRENMRPQMRVALAIRQVHIEPLERPNSLRNQAQQRHAYIIYPEAREPLVILDFSMLRVRFAPSPTGFLHIGSARTFIFNWLYARHNGGAMILRIDDTDVERNTQASLNSIFDGLRWLDLGWDEEYKQSERLALHRQVAEAIVQKGLAYRDFTPAHATEGEKSGAQGTWLFNAGMREMPRTESDRRAAAGEPFALRFR